MHCFYFHSEIAALSLNKILHEKPPLHDAFFLLKEKSSKWDYIGNGLGVPFNDREGLYQSSLSNEARLERVIKIWLETFCHTPVTCLNL